MGKTTISWCDYTFNPWRGCARVSAGCDHCYAERMAARNPRWFGMWGDGEAGVRVCAPDSYWRIPARWNRHAQTAGLEGDDRPRVFCGSMMDIFEDRPELVSWRAGLFEVIAETPNLQWMLLTKRPENARRLWSAAHRDTGRQAGICGELPVWLPNIWIGTTIENDAVATFRVQELLNCAAATKRFLSIEPLLGPIRLKQAIYDAITGLDWSGTRAQSLPQARDFIHEIIIGGESGPNARPCNTAWIRDLLGQADALGIPAYVKQLGANVQAPDDPPRCWSASAAGADPSEWPDDLAERAYPAKAE